MCILWYPPPKKSFNQVIYKLYKNSESIIYYLNIVLILGHFIKKVQKVMKCHRTHRNKLRCGGNSIVFIIYILIKYSSIVNKPSFKHTKL